MLQLHNIVIQQLFKERKLSELNKNPYRICIIEDDEDVLDYLNLMVTKRLNATTLLFQNAKDAVEKIVKFQPDVVLTDIEMPEINGLELIKQLHEKNPHIPVIVMTAHASIDYTISALKNHVKDFLTKPIDSPKLITALKEVADNFRKKTKNHQPDTVLAIGAHPDDVEIGVGGTLSAHHAAGNKINILTLSSGKEGGKSAKRLKESSGSAKLLDAELFFGNLEDTNISSTNPTIKIIEKIISKTQPNIVYTHSQHDRHNDHHNVHAAAIVATRNTPTVCCYQSPSTTTNYRPTQFVNIDGFTEHKLELLQCFSSQTKIRKYLEKDLILATARYWSRYSNGDGKYYEPLEILRDSGKILSTDS